MIVEDANPVRSRVSVRQAVVIMPPAVPARGQDAAWPSQMAPALLQDLIGVLVAVNGVTLFTAAPNLPDAVSLSRVLPEGIDVLVPEDETETRSQLLAAALRQVLSRNFERVVAVAPDTIRLTVRTVSTALSALASADAVAGRTPQGGLYLFGTKSLAGVELASAADIAGDRIGAATRLLAEARRVGLTLRWAEPLPRASELPLPELPSLLAEAATYPRAAAVARAAL